MDDEEVDLEDSDVELEDEGVEADDARVDPPDKIDIPAVGHGPKHDTGEASAAATVKDKQDVANMENISMGNRLNDGVQPVPLEVIPSQETRSERIRSHSSGQSRMGMLNDDKAAIPVANIPSQKSRKEKLRMPPSTSAAVKPAWDFSPPPIDIMSFIELPPGLESPPPQQKNAAYVDDDDFWENLSASELKQIDDVEKKARAQKDVSVEGVEMGAHKVPSSSTVKEADVDAHTPIEEKAAGALTRSTKSAPSSSRTPAYQPAPRRPACPGRALRSPYIECYRKDHWKCTKIEAHVYDVGCSASKRTTRSSSQSPSPEDLIISYPNYYATLKHLAESVKPGGELVNTIAEIGIYALNDKGENPNKQILPLRIASYILEDVLDNREIRSAFDRRTHHLDRSQLVMFPVLQKISLKRLDRTVGHYFLLVLNLREGRFEVLDSMRSIADTRLKDCCEALMSAIKGIWRIHYPGSRKTIDDYELLDIEVPQQTNNHDCGLHMLMHCEHWNGIILLQFKQKDIPIIQKLLTYKWLNHLENSAAWKCILGK